MSKPRQLVIIVYNDQPKAAFSAHHVLEYLSTPQETNVARIAERDTSSLTERTRCEIRKGSAYMGWMARLTYRLTSPRSGFSPLGVTCEVWMRNEIDSRLNKMLNQDPSHVEPSAVSIVFVFGFTSGPKIPARRAKIKTSSFVCASKV